MKSKKKTLVEALIYVLLIIVCVWLVSLCRIRCRTERAF